MFESTGWILEEQTEEGIDELVLAYVKPSYLAIAKRGPMKAWSMISKELPSIDEP